MTCTCGWSSTWPTHARCAVCDQLCRLLKDGTVGAHGPRNRRCPGSWSDPKPGIVVTENIASPTQAGYVVIGDRAVPYEFPVLPTTDDEDNDSRSVVAREE